MLPAARVVTRGEMAAARAAEKAGPVKGAAEPGAATVVEAAGAGRAAACARRAAWASLFSLWHSEKSIAQLGEDHGLSRGIGDRVDDGDNLTPSELEASFNCLLVSLVLTLGLGGSGSGSLVTGSEGGNKGGDSSSEGRREGRAGKRGSSAWDSCSSGGSRGRKRGGMCQKGTLRGLSVDHSDIGKVGGEGRQSVNSNGDGTDESGGREKLLVTIIGGEEAWEGVQRSARVVGRKVRHRVEPDLASRGMVSKRWERR